MMMKKYGLITKVLLISMFAILLSGCGNLLTSEFSSKTDETKFYTITGNIDVDAHSAKNSTRTGLPTIPSIDDNSINFSVSATKDGETITGEVSEMQYSITLLKGSWTITVIGEKAGVKVLEGSITVNTEDEPTTQQTITLKTINAGTGSLSLTISISKEENLSCGGVKATLYKNSGEESNDVKYLKFNDTDNNLIQLGFNDLPAGTYSIDLEFYQEMTSSTTTEGTYSCKNLLYSHHDTVNIFANLVTNTWTGSGYSEDKTTFTLTKAMITNFAMTTFYVSNSGDDSNAGTYFAPFATLQAAVNKVTEMNNVSPSNENAPYRILLLSDIEDTSTGEDIYTNDESLISIKNYPNPELYLKIASYQNDSCFKIKGASGRRIMNIQEDANVTIENITLTGGGNINDNGGGVYVAYNAIFTMGNGATISNCTGYNGGGVYVQSGTFTMNGGAISDCIAEQGGGVYVSGGTFTMENNSLISKNTSGNGGGVYVIGGTFTMTGGTISENKADCGGGIYVADTEGAQGTVVCVGQLTIEGGEISGNSAKYGGGVYIDSGDFTITGGKISENTSSIDGEGGGVYVKDGTFTIKNDALISKNTSCGNGGGVFAEGGNITINDGSISENIFSNDRSGGGGIYLTGTAKLTMTDGKISGNHPKGETSSDTFGGGVYISGESSIFTMTGGEISGNSAYYGGGVAIIGTFSMSGGTISGNIVTSSDGSKGNGSAVAVLTGGLFTVSESITINGDVYLFDDQTITVSNNFEGGEVMITPSNYESSDGVGVQVLKPIDGELLTTEIVRKFAVTPQVEETTEETINWTINAEGKIAKENAYYVSNTGSDNEGVTGSKDAPFATLQKAVETINGINDGASPYTIYVMNNINLGDDSSGTTSSAFINIAPTNSLNLKICGYNNQNVTINAQQKGRVMYIGENANVTLQNLILTGGYLKDENGAGLYILNNDANVIIKNCEISENVIDNGYGAGLRVGYNSVNKSLNLTIENSKIFSNTINHNNYVGEYSGAGIAIENVEANITIKDSEITGNKINQDGIENTTPGDKGVGLWLGNSAETTISGSTISGNIIENAASNNENAGGGVYLNGGTLTIQNSTENNTVISGNSSTIGGGVYVKTGTFTMNGGAVIYSDNDVYLANGTTITVTGNLTGTTPVATITPNEYSTTRQVITVPVSADGATSSVTLSEQVGKFEVTPQVLSDGNEYWFVDLYGYLGKVPKIETNDDGTAIYLMESYDNLLYIARELKTGDITSFNMKLTKDIEIPSGKWQFYQLNVADASTIDGQGHSITINEDVSSFGNDAGGLFYKFNNSTVKNLVLKGSITANTSAGGYIGALCRSAYGSIFENVMSEVTITDNGSGFAGGLIGRLGTSVMYDPTKAMVKNCAVYADVSSTNGIAGGILGAIWEVTRCCTIQNSIYMGEIKGTTVGAIVGKNENNDVAESVLNNIWYCVTNNSSIPLIGTKADTTEEVITAVESKSADDIASDAAAKLLNTNSDGTSNDAWVEGEKYPTLKSVN